MSVTLVGLCCFVRVVRSVCYVSAVTRSGLGPPVIGDLDGEYKHDSRRNVLEWCLPVIDANNKTGSLEFSIAGQPNDFFPVNVSFVSKRNYCDIQVGCSYELFGRVSTIMCPSHVKVEMTNNS